MNDRKTQLVFGALLHDVGKVVYRGISESGTHSKLGARFVEESLAANDTVDESMPSSVGSIPCVILHYISHILNSQGEELPDGPGSS